MGYRWTPTAAQKEKFKLKMREIEQFCIDNDIHHSLSKDSYYFTVNGKNYRVSNHSVESSNQHAFSSITGKQVRELYHPDGRDSETVYIHASKTRLIDIYNDLKAGYELDGRGRRKS